MATVRQYRRNRVADFRDQNGRRRIETPRGPFISKALQKRAALELLAQRLEEVRQKTYRTFSEKPDFSRLADLFLGSKVRVRKTTLDGYRELIDCYLRPYFRTRKVDEITSFEIEQFRDEMAKGVPASVQRERDARERQLRETPPPNASLRVLRPGPRTTNKCLTLLVGIMRYACRHKFASSNPVLEIEKLKESEGEARVIEENVLTPQELRRAIDSATEPWRTPIMFCVFTGARRAEILGLQWRDIDWTRRTARIERTWRRGAFYSPKTKASRRTVELPDELIDELRRWKLKCPNGARTPRTARRAA